MRETLKLFGTSVVEADPAGRLAEAELRLAELEVRVADLTEAVARREARCARLAATGDGTDIVASGDGGPQLNFIHADHLGRPAFVTDPSGAVIWDAGITTPFGVSIEAQDMGDAVQTRAFFVNKNCTRRPSRNPSCSRASIGMQRRAMTITGTEHMTRPWGGIYRATR